MPVERSIDYFAALTADDKVSVWTALFCIARWALQSSTTVPYSPNSLITFCQHVPKLIFAVFRTHFGRLCCRISPNFVDLLTLIHLIFACIFSLEWTLQWLYPCRNFRLFFLNSTFGFLTCSILNIWINFLSFILIFRFRRHPFLQAWLQVTRPSPLWRSRRTPGRILPRSRWASKPEIHRASEPEIFNIL